MRAFLGVLAKLRAILRHRVLLYTVLWSGIGVALVAALVLRTDIAMSVEEQMPSRRLRPLSSRSAPILGASRSETED